MPKRNIISEEEVLEIRKVRQENKDKTVDKWLEALLLHADGLKRAKIAEKTGFGKQYITDLVVEYKRVGLAEFSKKQYKGNHRNMSFAEEEAFLSQYKERAEQGQIVETSEMKAAYEKQVGHSIGGGQIYRLLKRHHWRKVKPRSQHPKKASEEVIEASKKLTVDTSN